MNLYNCVSDPEGGMQPTQSPCSSSLTLLSIGSGGGVSFCEGIESFSVGLGSLLLLWAGKRGCPRLLSRGDQSPAWYCCLAHFLSCKLSMERGSWVSSCCIGTWSGFVGSRWATALSNAWATLFSCSSKAISPVRTSTFIDVWKKWEQDY